MVFPQVPRLLVTASVALAVGLGALFSHTTARADEIPSTLAAKPANLEEMRKIESRVKDLVTRVRGTVVCIEGEKASGSGSGVIINKEGLILTAAHVTEATGKKLVIVFPDGKRVQGEALGGNRGTDAALAKITTPGEYAFAEMGDSNKLTVGDWLVALGHPGGYDRDRKPPVRLGRLWHRDVEGAILSDCTLIGGDSGGPLFDLDGKVVGIHSSINIDLEHNRHVALDHFRGDWDTLMKGKVWGAMRMNGVDRRRPKLGMLLDRKAQDGGAPVAEVPEGSSASAVGLKAGDRIIKLNETAIPNSWAMMRELSDLKPGTTIDLQVQREKDTLEVKLKLGQTSGGKVTEPVTEEDVPKARPKRPFAEPKVEELPKDKPWLGLGLEPGEKPNTVQVNAVAPGSPAEATGIKVGDILVKINDRQISDVTVASDLLRSAKIGDEVKLDFTHEGTAKTATTKLKKKE